MGEKEIMAMQPNTGPSVATSNGAAGWSWSPQQEEGEASALNSSLHATPIDSLDVHDGWHTRL